MFILLCSVILATLPDVEAEPNLVDKVCAERVPICKIFRFNGKNGTFSSAHSRKIGFLFLPCAHFHWGFPLFVASPFHRFSASNHRSPILPSVNVTLIFIFWLLIPFKRAGSCAPNE